MRHPADLSPAAVARALLDAEAQGDPAAARQHQVSTRTIRRWRLDVREGRLPEVAVLVQAGREEALRQSVDAFARARTAVLEAIELKAKESNATLSELTSAARVLLEHSYNTATLDWLLEHEEPLPPRKNPAQEPEREAVQ